MTTLLGQDPFWQVRSGGGVAFGPRPSFFIDGWMRGKPGGQEFMFIRCGQSLEIVAGPFFGV